MGATVVVGMQWGDEGKGKIIDVLAETGLYDVVVRYQGGPNAGHTVVVDGRKIVLHSLPSAVLHKGITNVCGNGMVLDLEALVKELRELEEFGAPVQDFKISERAHIIFPYHIEADSTSATSKKIDTTKRGIGPCYTDKISREGIRICDLLRPEIADPKIIEKAKKTFDDVKSLEILQNTFALFEKIEPYIADTSKLIYDALRAGKGVLLEGAQGTMLDIDHGTYTFVTSSNTSAGGAATGTGIGPRDITEVIGIVKAYTTRVGEGPFPTELDYKTNEIGARLQKIGAEFGATTGRPRRCGWLDMVQLKYAARINSLSDVVITKLDVLDSEPEIKICVGYRRGKEFLTDTVPPFLADCEPIYRTFKGWQKSTTKCDTFESLPQEAKEYLGFIEKELGVPISIISVGNDRKATIYRPRRAA